MSSLQPLGIFQGSQQFPRFKFHDFSMNFHDPFIPFHGFSSDDDRHIKKKKKKKERKKEIVISITFFKVGSTSPLLATYSPSITLTLAFDLDLKAR